MKLEHYSEKKLRQSVLRIINKYLDSNRYQVFFFGSRVRGDNFERSDIDLGIEGPVRVSASIKLKIQEELDNLPLLYKIDLVDFNNVSKNFNKEAVKYKEYVR